MKNDKNSVDSDMSTTQKAIGEVKDNWGLAPRAALAAIPVIGSAASVLVEGYISNRSEQRVSEMLNSLAERIEENRDLIDTISDDLLESASLKLHLNHEKWKPGLFARILCDSEASTDEIFRSLLLDQASQLTDFDYITFVRVVAPKKRKDLNFSLASIERELPGISSIKEISLEKLVTLGLLSKEGEGSSAVYAATHIGKKLAEII